MVYFPLYDKILANLPEDIIKQSKKIIEGSFKNKPQNMKDELLIELILFYSPYPIKEYLDDAPLDSLETEILENLLVSKRRTYKVLGKDGSDFYFQDSETGEERIIESQAPLLEWDTMNTRLVFINGRYYITSLILHPEDTGFFDELDALYSVFTKFTEAKENFDDLMEQSEKVDESKIQEYDQPDQQLMRLNRRFKETHGYSIPEFLSDVFAVSETKFETMARDYLGFSDEFFGLIQEKGYIASEMLISYPEILQALLGFKAGDKQMLDEGIAKIMEEEEEMKTMLKEEFEIDDLEEHATFEPPIQDLVWILYAKKWFDEKGPHKAYEAIANIESIPSDYQILFFLGKVSRLCNKDYKRYFLKAKKLDKQRYKEDLAHFLQELE
ncbi:MAG: hypothetical protein ACQESG_07225 [Nanobdellota archaeon]